MVSLHRVKMCVRSACDLVLGNGNLFEYRERPAQLRRMWHCMQLAQVCLCRVAMCLSVVRDDLVPWDGNLLGHRERPAQLRRVRRCVRCSQVLCRRAMCLFGARNDLVHGNGNLLGYR